MMAHENFEQAQIIYNHLVDTYKTMVTIWLKHLKDTIENRIQWPFRSAYNTDF
jgi:hypothetical protein